MVKCCGSVSTVRLREDLRIWLSAGFYASAQRMYKMLFSPKHFIATSSQAIRITKGKGPWRIKPNVCSETQFEDSVLGDIKNWNGQTPEQYDPVEPALSWSRVKNTTSTGTLLHKLFYGNSFSICISSWMLLMWRQKVEFPVIGFFSKKKGYIRNIMGKIR